MSSWDPSSLEGPQSKLIFESSSFKNQNSRHRSVISEHFFNHKLQVLIPGCSEIPKTLQQAVEGVSYFCTALPVFRLIKKEFIEAFVKKGKISMLSIGTGIDEGDVVALTPSGHLLMHVSKDTYESLGIDGRPSQFSKLSACNKYIVDIDLTESCFRPGKKKYERVYECLNKRYPHKLTFLFDWTPHDDSISALSLAAYFESLGYQYEEVDVASAASHLVHVTSRPVVDASTPEGSHVAADRDDVFEWLGATLCGVDISAGSVDGYVSTLCNPEPSEPISGAMMYSATGFLSTTFVLDVLEALRAACKEKCKWCVLAVHGFADSPVSWSQREHMHHFEGDNLYVYIVWPDDNYWLHTAIGTLDVCP